MACAASLSAAWLDLWVVIQGHYKNAAINTLARTPAYNPGDYIYWDGLTVNLGAPVIVSGRKDTCNQGSLPRGSFYNTPQPLPHPVKLEPVSCRHTTHTVPSWAWCERKNREGARRTKTRETPVLALAMGS